MQALNYARLSGGWKWRALASVSQCASVSSAVHVLLEGRCSEKTRLTGSVIIEGLTGVQ